MSSTTSTESELYNTEPTNIELNGQPEPSNINETNAERYEPESTNETDSESNELLSGENMSLLLLFLAVYFVTYFVLGFFMNPSGEQTLGTRISRIVDLVLTFFIIALIAYFFFAVDNDDKENYLRDKGNELKEYIESEFSPLFQVGFIVIFYLFIYLFRIPMKMGQKPALIFITESLLWLLLLAIIVVKFFILVFDVNILDDFTQLFRIKKEEKKPAYEPPKETKEVFNISNNNYNFDEAQAVCKAYGAELATYDQIEDAYNKGAEWCNYGWSANQMAFFPTQKATWQKLQSSEKHKNNCGRPGVNGGFMGNPNLRFGINCYGKKPIASDNDKDRLANSEPTIPITPENSELANKIKKWKENPDKYLQVNSFNYNKWSKHE